MAVNQHKDGRYMVNWYEGPRGQKKPKRKYFGRSDEDYKKACEFNNSLGIEPRKKRTDKSSPTFHELVDAYSTAKYGVNEETTKISFYYKMTSIICPRIGHLPAVKLTVRRMQKYIEDRLNDPVVMTIKYGKGWKKTKTKIAVDKRTGEVRKITRNTVNSEIRMIQAVLNFAASDPQNYIVENPAKGLKKPTSDAKRIKPPSKKETQKLIELAPKNLKRALTISYYTGVRPGKVELFQIKWDDVDFDGRTIYIRSAMKKGPRERYVPITNPDFLKTLQKWKNSDNGNRWIMEHAGKPVGSLQPTFERVKEKAGITRRLRLYDLRHAFATEALRNHADLGGVQKALGHSRPDTTLKFYQHVDMGVTRDAVSRIPSLELDDPESGDDELKALQDEIKRANEQVKRILDRRKKDNKK